jgi:membrane-associated phospholipid phosphatase
MNRLLNLDRKLTKKLCSYGRNSLEFWKFIASKGMWGFVGIWIGIAGMGWMTWWEPLIPLVLSYIALLIVQAIIKRERQDFEKISGYKMWIRTYSFPSGHSTESAALTFALALYPVYPSVMMFSTVCGLLSLICVLVVYSRIAVGVHYLADVIAGLCLGAVYAAAFM